MSDVSFTPEKREQFLAALRLSPNVTMAARAVGVSRTCVYQHKAADEAFAKAWQEAIDEGVEVLEAEAERRAFQGTDKPVTFQGAITDTFKEYSDTLAIFLLKAHRPDKYRERSEVKVDAGDLTKQIVDARRRADSVI